jgi:hypothetical protein
VSAQWRRAPQGTGGLLLADLCGMRPCRPQQPSPSRLVSMCRVRAPGASRHQRCAGATSSWTCRPKRHCPRAWGGWTWSLADERALKRQPFREA